MIDKSSIEQFLRINGIAPTASDEEIKSVLLSAQWHDDDVEAAMLVLRENTHTKENHVDSLHKVFRSDERLTPDSVAALLGIEMDVSEISIPGSKPGGSHRTLLVILTVGILTFCLAMAFVAGSMWMLQVGPFHQTQLPI